MIGMAQDDDVAVTGGTFGTEGAEGMLGMGGVTADGGGDLLVDDDVNFDAGLCPSFQDLVESEFLVEEGGSSEEELGTQPPVFDVDGLFRVLQGNGDSIEVVLAVNVPFDLVPISFRSE